MTAEPRSMAVPLLRVGPPGATGVRASCYGAELDQGPHRFRGWIVGPWMLAARWLTVLLSVLTAIGGQMLCK